MLVAEERCGACDAISKFSIREGAVLLRDAVCEKCRCSLRTSDLLKEIYKLYDVKDVQGLRKSMNGKRILNAGSKGFVHNILQGCSGEYIPSEYYDNWKSGEINLKTGILSVDLTNMPFENESLDLIISEDVLEHVWDIEKACSEIQRCLRKSGYHIFTIPIAEGMKTKNRIGNKNKVYHGDPIRSEGALVISEFGLDFEEVLNKYGFATQIKMCHKFYEPEETTSCDDSYDEYLKNMESMDKYFKYNSIVFICQRVE